MQDTTDISINTFKNTVFLWEIIITIIVFGAAYFILKGFKEKEKKARQKNSEFNTGE